MTCRPSSPSSSLTGTGCFQVREPDPTTLASPGMDSGLDFRELCRGSFSTVRSNCTASISIGVSSRLRNTPGSPRQKERRFMASRHTDKRTASGSWILEPFPRIVRYKKTTCMALAIQWSLQSFNEHNLA